MLCYVMLCYAMLCCVISYNAMLKMLLEEVVLFFRIERVIQSVELVTNKNNSLK